MDITKVVPYMHRCSYMLDQMLAVPTPVDIGQARQTAVIRSIIGRVNNMGNIWYLEVAKYGNYKQVAFINIEVIFRAGSTVVDIQRKQSPQSSNYRSIVIPATLSSDVSPSQ